MKNFRLILLLLLSALISACELAVFDDDDDPAADSDQDGLTNSEELNVYFTNPDVADTDGDGISDGDEVNELGFNAAANLYRFNPLIADLPVIGVNIETVPDLVLRYTDTEGNESSLSNSSGGEKVTIETDTFTAGISTTVSVEAEVSASIKGPETKVTAKAEKTASFEYSKTQTEENHENWETVTANSTSASRETDSASIRVGISIENISNLTYSLEHISLVASYPQVVEVNPNNSTVTTSVLKPIATLGYDAAGGGFQRTSFAPGEKSNTLLFSFDDLDLGTALDVLKDARSLIVEPALFELSNADGRPFDFDEGEVDAKTAFIVLDYGIVRPQEKYQVSMLSSLGDGSLDVATILTDILAVDYQQSSGIDTIRNIGGDPSSRWVILVTHDDGFIENTSYYDVEIADYDPAEIEIFPGDTVSVIYMTDVDGDGVGIREEFLNGTDPMKPDTDGDGLTDKDEIRNSIQVNAFNILEPGRYPATVKSNPLLEDTDGDTLGDAEEIARGLDPNNPDTDGDGIGDKTDTFNGQAPIAADLVITLIGGKEISLTGLVTPKEGTQVQDVTIDWGDGAPNDSFSSSLVNESLFIPGQHTYAGPGKHNITITMTNTDTDPITPDVTITHQASFEVFDENMESDYFGTSGAAVGGPWSEAKHIRTLADMDGDGNLDLVGFGNDGVYVSLWNAGTESFDTPTAWLTGHYGSEVAGGNYDKVNHPRHLVDWDNDGLPDVVAFAQNGTVWSKNCGLAEPNTLKAASACGTADLTLFETISTNFGAGSSTAWNPPGWNPANHFRTITDVDKNGFLDIVAMGQNEIFTLRNFGNGSYTQVDNAIGGTSFTTSNGWNNTGTYRFVDDINGDGHADIVGAGFDGMFYSLGQVDGRFGSVGTICTSSQSCFTNSLGWNPNIHPIFLGDMNNDGLPDLIGMGYAAIFVSLNESSGTDIQFGAFNVWSSQFVSNTGWQIGTHPRYLADFNGDGYNDIVGFSIGAAGSLNRIPNGEQLISPTLNFLSTSFDLSTAWQSPSLVFNTRLTGDYNGDGIDDVVGFRNDGVIAQRSPVIVQPAEPPAN